MGLSVRWASQCDSQKGTCITSAMGFWVGLNVCLARLDSAHQSNVPDEVPLCDLPLTQSSSLHTKFLLASKKKRHDGDETDVSLLAERDCFLSVCAWLG